MSTELVSPNRTLLEVAGVCATEIQCTCTVHTDDVDAVLLQAV
jgi:hypothetical protein